jgi:hypothetical protein
MKDAQQNQPPRLHPTTLAAISSFEEAAQLKKKAREVISDSVRSVPTDEIFDYLAITEQIEENYA